MADYTTSDLETIAGAVLFGPRNVRLNVMNAFRAKAGLDPVEYLVNVHIPEPDAVHDALEAIKGVEDDGGTSTHDDEDLVTAFTAALVKDRAYRIELLNAFVVAGGGEAEAYYANTYRPHPDAVNDAIGGVADAE